MSTLAQSIDAEIQQLHDQWRRNAEEAVLLGQQLGEHLLAAERERDALRLRTIELDIAIADLVVENKRLRSELAVATRVASPGARA